jgi:hypothetical protein
MDKVLLRLQQEVEIYLSCGANRDLEEFSGDFESDIAEAGSDSEGDIDYGDFNCQPDSEEDYDLEEYGMDSQRPVEPLESADTGFVFEAKTSQFFASHNVDRRLASQFAPVLSSGQTPVIMEVSPLIPMPNFWPGRVPPLISMTPSVVSTFVGPFVFVNESSRLCSALRLPRAPPLRVPTVAIKTSATRTLVSNLEGAFISSSPTLDEPVIIFGSWPLGYLDTSTSTSYSEETFGTVESLGSKDTPLMLSSKVE